jgi:pyruvate dehydrogenase E2 component (dihydrolipoamide acetyltransferase)
MSITNNDKPLDAENRVISKETRLSGYRKIVGNRMSASLAKSPQATISIRVDVSSLSKLKAEMQNRGEKVSYTDLIIKSIACALKLHPEINVSIQDDKIFQYESINIGIAVETKQGLFVPVIRDALTKTVLEISTELKSMVENLREGNIDPEYFKGGTFTISNLGMFDIDFMTPIINIPEAAILCIGAIRKEFDIADDDTTRIIPVTTLSLTLDHGAMDGAAAARFLGTIRSIIANPEQYFYEKHEEESR